MSKKAKVNVNLDIQPEVKSTVSHTSSTSNFPLLFSKKNYQLMALGLLVIFLGFGLMMGTNNDVESLDAVFPKNEVYSFRRIILAPAVVILGFLIELYSILSIKKSAE